MIRGLPRRKGWEAAAGLGGNGGGPRARVRGGGAPSLSWETLGALGRVHPAAGCLSVIRWAGDPTWPPARELGEASGIGEPFL